MHSRREGEGGREVTLTCRRQQNALEAVEKLLSGINQILRSEDGRGGKGKKKKKVSYHIILECKPRRECHGAGTTNWMECELLPAWYCSPPIPLTDKRPGAAGMRGGGPRPGGLSHR